MKKLLIFTILLFCLSFKLEAQSLEDYRAYLVQYEGYEKSPYKDGKSWGIGVGHNLSAHGQRVKKYSAGDINLFFEEDLRAAINEARKDIPKFDNLPQKVKFVTINLIWSVGPTGFRKFKNYITSVNDLNFVLAADAVFTSKWIDQVPTHRSYDMYKDLEDAAFQATAI